MQILVASPRGFCAGVERAIETVNSAMKKYPQKKIFVYHEIVHNTHVVRDFERKGITFIEDITQATPDSVLVLSAHGVSEEIEMRARSSDLTLVDATCPLVSKIHREVQEFEKKDFTILIIGNKNHAEVIGTVGRAKRETYILEKLDDIEKLPQIRGNLAYVTQSTLSVEHVSMMVEKLKAKFPGAVGQSDICYATKNRQEAVKALAREVDLMLIIGSNNSSNSKNLMKVSSKICQKAFLVDNHQALQDHYFDNVKKIGISSGASAPEILVEQLISSLKKKFSPLEVIDFDFKKEEVKFKLPKM